MNHLQNLDALPNVLANWLIGSDGIFQWWQVGLFVVLIGLIVALVIIRKRGQ